jgi:hypothetical protein
LFSNLLCLVRTTGIESPFEFEDPTIADTQAMDSMSSPPILISTELPNSTAETDTRLPTPISDQQSMSADTNLGPINEPFSLGNNELQCPSDNDSDSLYAPHSIMPSFTAPLSPPPTTPAGNTIDHDMAGETTVSHIAADTSPRRPKRSAKPRVQHDQAADLGNRCADSDCEDSTLNDMIQCAGLACGSQVNTLKLPFKSF